MLGEDPLSFQLFHSGPGSTSLQYIALPLVVIKTYHDDLVDKWAVIARI